MKKVTILHLLILLFLSTNLGIGDVLLAEDEVKTSLSEKSEKNEESESEETSQLVPPKYYRIVLKIEAQLKSINNSVYSFAFSTPKSLILNYSDNSPPEFFS